MIRSKFKIINRKIIFILLLAIFLRIYNLNINPPSLSPDEASLGYNTYSILKTGRDEYGEFLPLIFKSFGDYKPGLYVYMTVPFVYIFGLNEWAVRLPSAIAGVIAVFVCYLIIIELFKDRFKNSGRYINTQYIAWVTAFLLAISPWHVQFGRGAWEVNVALTLTLIGIYFFLKALKTPKNIVFSTFFFALTLITYQGAKLSTLIVLIVLFIVFMKEIVNILRKNTKTIIISLVVLIIVSSPSLLSFNKGQTGRLTVFSIFSYPRPRAYLENMLKENNEKIGDLNYLLFHSEILNFKRGILGRYFNHFSTRFLFFEGDYQNPKHSSPNSGMLLLFDLILLPLGTITLIRKADRISVFIFLWLLLSPLPAVLTRDQVQAVRAYNMVIPLTIISSFGLVTVYGISKDMINRYKIIGILFSGFIVFAFIGSLIYFFDSFFIHLPIHNAKYWNYGYKQVIEEILPIQNKYKVIYFQQSYDQPYIYYLFYSKYSPGKYQKQANLSYYLGPDVGLVEKLDNIHFTGWSWPYATGEQSTLIIGNSVAIPSDFNPKDYRLISEIKYPDGYMTAFRIVETR